MSDLLTQNNSEILPEVEKAKNDSFLKDKACLILVALSRNMMSDNLNKSEVAKKVGTTHSHSQNTVKILEEKGFVLTQAQGRERKVKLTDRGKKAAKILESLI